MRFLYKADDRKLITIPPGVDTSHFYPIPPDEAKMAIGIKPDVRMILFVGRIEPLKGVDTLIRAMSCLKLNHPDHPVHLAIIGGEPDASLQQMSCEMARLQKAVRRTRFRSNGYLFGKARAGYVALLLFRR